MRKADTTSDIDATSNVASRVIATVLLLWVGQDLSYSPGWAHPMAYYFALAITIIIVFGITGMALRKGTPRLD